MGGPPLSRWTDGEGAPLATATAAPSTTTQQCPVLPPRSSHVLTEQTVFAVWYQGSLPLRTDNSL